MVNFEITHFMSLPINTSAPKKFFVNIIIKEYSQDFYNYVLNFVIMIKKFLVSESLLTIMVNQ